MRTLPEVYTRSSAGLGYRGTSRTRNRDPTVGRRPGPQGDARGKGLFLMSEVSLKLQYAMCSPPTTAVVFWLRRTPRDGLSALKRRELERIRILYEKTFNPKLSGDEACYTACSALVMTKKSCCKLH